MRRTLATVIGLATLAAGLAVSAPAAHAAAGDPDLTGSWKSASLRSDGVGYALKLKAECDPPNCYSGVLRFHYQNGRMGPRIPVGVTSVGRHVFLLITGEGSLMGDNPNTLKGSVGEDGSIFFPTCYKQFSFASKKTADEACLFQEIPS
jgi:hypothetical protein